MLLDGQRKSLPFIPRIASTQPESLPATPPDITTVTDSDPFSAFQVADNEMLVDEYEQYHNDRTDDVVVSRSGSEEPEPEPLANDCKDLLLANHPTSQFIPMNFTMPTG